MNSMSQEEKKYLSLAPFFIADLFEVDIKDIIAPYLFLAKRISIQKKDQLLEYGQIVNNIYYVSKGITGELMMNKNGLEQLSINFPNSLLGFGSAAHQQPIFYSSYALTEAEAYVFPYVDFLSLMQQNDKLLALILKYTSLDARRTNHIIVQHTSYSALQKISQILYCCHIAGKYYPKFKQLRLTQQLIASLCGMHRISAVNVLKELREMKYISMNKKELRILEPELLKEKGFEL